MEILPQVKNYIDNHRSLYTGSSCGLLPPITDPDEPLQLDSLGLIRLIAFLENDLGIHIEDEEIIAENFVTLRQIGQLLATKTQTS